MAKKRPTLVFTRFPYESAWGGEESHTLGLARSFSEQGYEIVFLGSCPILLQKFAEEGFHVKKVKAGQMIVTPTLLLKSFFLFPLWRYRLRRAFKQLLREYKLEAAVFLSLNEKLFLSPLVLKEGLALTWIEHQEIRSWLLRSPWKFCYQKQAKKVKIIPISPKNKKILEKELSIDPKNIIDILHGVKVGRIPSALGSRQKGLILAANRLIPKKGMKDILEAFSLLLKAGHPVCLRMLGEGPEEEELRQMIKKRALTEHVELMKPLTKELWQRELERADVYVSAARDENETFSLNTAEAMSAGCKVVVTDCSGIAHHLNSGQDAFLAQPSSPKDLAQKMTLALNAPEEMRALARKTAQMKFDLKRMLKEYASVILRRS